MAKKLTETQKEKLEVGKQILEYKTIAESNVVSIFWKQPELIFDYLDDISLEDFNNNCWKVYYVIAYEIIIKEQKKSLDDITVGLYLQHHPKLHEKYYDEFDGSHTVEKLKGYMQVENLDSYVKQLKKWNTVMKLWKMDFPIKERLPNFVDMTIDEIYDVYEGVLNHVFTNVGSDDVVHDLTDGLPDLIESMDKGVNVGLPYKDMPMLTADVGGSLVGNITLCCGVTGAGKSSITRNILVPSVLENDEKILFMINEEDEKKVKSELLVYVANNIILKNNPEKLKKYTVRDGNYEENVKKLLYESAEYLQQHKGKVKIVAFKRYTTSRCIKYIKKFASLGFNYFVLDTFKKDSNASINQKDWEALSQSMSDLYDTVKPVNKNVHLWVSAQLTKVSDKQRYLGLGDIGISKNMTDTVSTCIMIRKLFDDEYKGEKKELKVYKLMGKSNVPVTLDPKKKYQIIFIPKNRFGQCDTQIVLEHDLSTNVYKEVGFCRVPVDF